MDTIHEAWSGEAFCVCAVRDPCHILAMRCVTPRAWRRRRVLVIEDEAEIRDILVQLLAALGARVVAAADGFEGLEHLARWHPDMVLCDLAMPVMGGLEFAQRMRQDPRYRNVLLIAVTGYNRQADLYDTWSTGFDGHLAKPIRMPALAALAQRLEGSRATREIP
jgi:two-component system CheB/CheR fusion protein